MRTSIVMEPKQVLRERLIALTRLRITQIQESVNLNHTFVSRTLLVQQHRPEGPQDLYKNLFRQPKTHLSTCLDVSSE